MLPSEREQICCRSALVDEQLNQPHLTLPSNNPDTYMVEVAVENVVAMLLRIHQRSLDLGKRRAVADVLATGALAGADFQLGVE